MEARCDIKSNLMVGQPNRLSPTSNGLSKRPRILWTVCAATSLLTSQHLYTFAGLGFAVHIHLLQWLVVAAYFAFDTIWQRRRSYHHLSTLSLPTWGLLSVLAALMALSVGLTLQAVVHFHNIAGLVMFATVSILELERCLLPDSSRHIRDLYRPLSSVLMRQNLRSGAQPSACAIASMPCLFSVAVWESLSESIGCLSRPLSPPFWRLPA